MTNSPLIWNVGENIFITLEVLNPNTTTGLPNQVSFISLTIQRSSDDKYWTGSSWSITRTVLSFTEIDNINNPGLYRYILPGSTGNVQEDIYTIHANISNPPIVEADTYEVHVSRQQIIRVYESEAV